MPTDIRSQSLKRARGFLCRRQPKMVAEPEWGKEDNDTERVGSREKDWLHTGEFIK